MSEASLEKGKEAQASERKAFWLGVRIGILYFFSAANIVVLLFVVPKFQLIFDDTLPGKPLPSVTLFVFSCRILIMIGTLGWPILSALFINRPIPHAILFINTGLIVTFLQLGITIISLLMPMATLDQGIVDFNS